nr:cysteine-rich KTR domain-containing protein [uncultured Oscillibacter sp.]
MRDRKNELRWVPCPICGGRTQIRVYPDTVLINFPLYCRKCRKETRINVVQLKMVVSGDQDV